MATATCKLAVLNPPQYDIGSTVINYWFTLTFSAATDTYATGGITCDLTQAGNIANSTSLPLLVWVQSTTAQGASHQSYFQYCQGTTQKNGLLQIFTAGAEKTNGQAMNAGDNENSYVIRVCATFPRR